MSKRIPKHLALQPSIKRVTRPSMKLLKFAENYTKNGNATQAVIDAGYNVNGRVVAGNIGYENLKKPQVWEMINSFSPNAVDNIEYLANKAKNESVRLNANKDILDRAGFNPINKTEQTNINIEVSDERFGEIMSQFASKNDELAK
jgi:phage terminase small subunit